MNLFNKLVEQALENQPHLSPLKIVVEDVFKRDCSQNNPHTQ